MKHFYPEDGGKKILRNDCTKQHGLTSKKTAVIIILDQLLPNCGLPIVQNLQNISGLRQEWILKVNVSHANNIS
jgi:hypothetical protein